MRPRTWLTWVIFGVCVLIGVPALGDDATGEIVAISDGNTKPLQDAFNAEREKLRLLLILSPT